MFVALAALAGVPLAFADAPATSLAAAQTAPTSTTSVTTSVTAPAPTASGATVVPTVTSTVTTPNVAIAGPGVLPAISPIDMFVNATPVVKAVMILLVLASLLSWTVWIAKTAQFIRGRRLLKATMDRVYAAKTLEDLQELACPAVMKMVNITRTELTHSSQLIRGGVTDGIKDRVETRLVRAEAGVSRQMALGIGILASIGSVAPFIGLFGTVWGIMHSFIGIAASSKTSLAVVAPGIAEALLATGLGLVAAIPATLMYNGLARIISHYRSELADSAALIVCLMSSDVDHMHSSVNIDKPRAVLAGR